MNASEVERAMAAAKSIAGELDVSVADATILNNSNRLTLRLTPCDVVARAAPMAYRASAELEVAIAWHLAEIGAPVAALVPREEPRTYVRDGFVINLWTYYEPLPSGELPPADYAQALERLHAGMRKVDMVTPHFTDRVAQAQHLVASRDRTPSLADDDRVLLRNALRSLREAITDRGAAEQLLHGEPHPGNVLNTHAGPRFIDLETCCRGPIEFDLAHAPDEVSAYYPDLDHELLDQCRSLMRAMVTTWRWDRDDQFPNGRQMGTEGLSQIRAALERHGIDTAP